MIGIFTFLHCDTDSFGEPVRRALPKLRHRTVIEFSQTKNPDGISGLNHLFDVEGICVVSVAFRVSSKPCEYFV